MPICFFAQQIPGIMYLHHAFLGLYIWIVKKAWVYKRLASSPPVQSIFIYIHTVLKNKSKSHEKANSDVYAEMALCMMTFNLHLKFLPAFWLIVEIIVFTRKKNISKGFFMHRTYLCCLSESFYAADIRYLWSVSGIFFMLVSAVIMRLQSLGYIFGGFVSIKNESKRLEDK